MVDVSAIYISYRGKIRLGIFFYRYSGYELEIKKSFAKKNSAAGECFLLFAK